MKIQDFYIPYFSQIIPPIMNDLSIHTNFSSEIKIITLIISNQDRDSTNFQYTNEPVGDDSSVGGPNSFSADYLKAGTDYGTYSAAQPDAAAKNMMFASVDSQQTCCEQAMNML